MDSKDFWKSFERAIERFVSQCYTTINKKDTAAESKRLVKCWRFSLKHFDSSSKNNKNAEIIENIIYDDRHIFFISGEDASQDAHNGPRLVVHGAFEHHVRAAIWCPTSHRVAVVQYCVLHIKSRRTLNYDATERLMR